MLTESLLLGVLGAAAVIAVMAVGGTDDELVPELVEQNIFPRDAEREYEIEN